ncbi:UNVERIFIED_CONTAM: hypothetical protein FKN15_054091 [Acipenser sinensis]
MSGNLSSPCPGNSSEAWQAPSFTRAAQFRVGATILLFSFAAVTNLAVLFSVAQGGGRRLSPRFRPLILSLTLADLMMTFVVMPLDAVWNVTVQWYAGDVLCKLLCFLKLFAMHASAFILVAISLDRHAAILYPLSSLDSQRRNKRMLLVAWSASLMLASPQLFIFRTIKAVNADFTQCVTHGSFKLRWQETLYNMFHFVTLYVMPLLVMIFCYVRIMLEINRQMKKNKAHRYHPCADSGGRRRTHTVLRSVCRQPTAFFHTVDSPCSHPRATASEDNAALWQLTGKPAGARPDYRGRWCTVSRGHPDRPNPPSPWATLDQLSATPWELPSSVGKGIAWTRTRDVQTIGHILNSTQVLLLDAPLRSP